MSDWKLNKGLGPWVFNPQTNKWGYLNNPRWQPTARAFVRGGPDDYDGRGSEEPQVWTSPDKSIVQSSGNEKVHNLCGHWHKDASGQLVLGPCIWPGNIDIQLVNGLVFSANLQTNPSSEFLIPGLLGSTITLSQDPGGSNFRTGTFYKDTSPLFYAQTAPFHYVDLSPIPILQVESISIAFWFWHKGGDIHAQNMLAFGHSGTTPFGNGYSIWPDASWWAINKYYWHIDTLAGGSDLEFYLDYFEGAPADPNVYPALNKWHMLIFTYDAVSGYQNVYVDGLLRNTNIVPAAGPIYYGDPPGPTEIVIGNSYGYIAVACNGAIPCVKIWNRALSQEEVTLLNIPF
jgi:hypothetical protein